MHELAPFLQSISHQANPDALRVLAFMIPMLIVIFMVMIAVIMVPCWFILKKAGFSPWLCLLCLLPTLGTLVLLYVIAFAEWKVIPAPRMAWQPPAAYPPPPVAPQV